MNDVQTQEDSHQISVDFPAFCGSEKLPSDLRIYESQPQSLRRSNHVPGAGEVSSEDTWGIRRSIVRARAALTCMRLEDASRATAQLERLLSNRSEPSFTRFAYALRILEASIRLAEDDFSAARSVLMSVAAHTGDTLAATVLRYLDWQRGENDEIDVPDTVDYLAAPVGGKAVCRILTLCVSAGLAFDRLQLAVSANLATEALRLARVRYGNYSPMSTFPATLLAQVAYEQGRLDEVEALLRPRFSVIHASGILECVARASVLLARVSLHRGKDRAALTILSETQALGRVRRWPRLVSIASSEYARALEKLRYEGHGPERSTPKYMRPSPIPPRAGLDTRWPDTLSFSAFESALRRACSAASHGSVDDSYELLIPWLQIGAARGLCMAFVDAGRPLLPLLEGLYYAPVSNDPRLSNLRPYIATLLRFTAQLNTEKSSTITFSPLSRREIGILQLIADGMSNKGIARSLGIAPETVKSHAKSVFIKLATRTRAQAVARAEAIGFLWS
jgi:ATP/maltotriose-dependent transcriptional regulator MalT